MSASRTQLARHTEDIYVFIVIPPPPPYLSLAPPSLQLPPSLVVQAHGSERERFVCNTPLHADTRHDGRVSNFVTAANNGSASPSPCKARFSSVMVVLQKYIAPGTPGVTTLDPSVGSGTMVRACSQLGFSCVRIELVRETHRDSACWPRVHACCTTPRRHAPRLWQNPLVRSFLLTRD